MHRPGISTPPAMLLSACVRLLKSLSPPNISMNMSKDPDSAEDLDFDSLSNIYAIAVITL